MFLNEATLLDNIKNRYYKDKIYVSQANLFEEISNIQLIFVLFIIFTDIRREHSHRCESLQRNQRALREDNNQEV